MALSARGITGPAGNGLAAAATARPATGGRGVASAAQTPVEASDFSANVGVNDNGILHYDDNSAGQQGNGGGEGRNATPFVARGVAAFQVESLSEQESAGGGGVMFADILHGVGIYEGNLRLLTGAYSRPGSKLNMLM